VSPISFGFTSELRVFTGDTALLNAYITEEDDETPVAQDDIAGVTFTVRRPGDPPNSPAIDQQPGTIPEDGLGQFLVPANITTVAGEYLARAQFTLTDGTIKSVIMDFDVIDPFEDVGASPGDGVVDMTWRMFEDLFDSELGGPWLRDMTKARFDKTKLRQLIPQALMDINFQQPQTDFSEDNFPYSVNDGTALFAQALLVASVRHLMRSYTEQPDVMNSQVGFFDRKRYTQAWKFIYDIEEAKLKEWLWGWKLYIYRSNNSALLVGIKAGRILPASLRSRGIWRGYY
jgi:hypothetical protein